MFTRRSWLKVAAVSAAAAASAIFGYIAGYNASVKVERSSYQPALKTVKLPPASKKGYVSVEEALWRRRSIREYSEQPLDLTQLSQLLWAAQGITLPQWGFRTAPSAGATYPLEVYVVVGSGCVKDLEEGVYHYNPRLEEIALIAGGDRRRRLAVAALDQEWVANARVNIVIAAVFERTTRRYGERGVRYVYMEAGHASQNIYLQATALGLATVVIGAFYDEQVQSVLEMPSEHKPLYIHPVGYPK
jgi:SagB-type dehydrogenase family enzyme